MKVNAQRFKLQEFTNPRTGSQSWRVAGIKRDGSRIRENFSDLKAAQCRQLELETEWLTQRPPDSAIRATWLSQEQLQTAELAIKLLGDDWPSLPLAVQFWRANGKQQVAVESPRLDDAVAQFNTWLETTDDLRDRSKANLRLRVGIFANSVSNARLADITPDSVFAYLEKRKVSKASKDNDRRVLSRFFAWCIARPRRWLTVNPARKETRERRSNGNGAPAILTLDQCQKLLDAAQAHKSGRLVPYVAVCLFGGLRPFEAARLTWQQVNLKDREIRLEGWQTKTGRSRVVAICDTMHAWLSACEGNPFYPSNWRKDFDAVRQSAGITEWPEDVMRHTAISHFFRLTGSYGRAAEQFGNSEAIIKAHYQGRVSSDDTKTFYAVKPSMKETK